MNEQALVEQRMQAVLRMARKDPYVATFGVLTILSVLLTLCGFAGLVRMEGFVLMLLALVFAGATACCYFERRSWSAFPLLAWVVGVAVFIRTRNLAGLRDVTTGGWTLGPDLDPFLFLRWAKYIVQHGTLMTLDMFRYLPFGYNTHDELSTLSYLIAAFHGVATWFGSGSIEQSAALFPVFMFAITVIAFYFFVREAFKGFVSPWEATIIGLVAALFLSISPPFLPRTIGGIPEKESAAFFFMFAALYFFIKSWKSDNWKNISIFSFGAGIMTAGMALVWGGYAYILITIAPAVLLAYLFKRQPLQAITSYGIWLMSTFLIASQFSTRYSLMALLQSALFLILVGVAGLFLVHQLIFKTSLHRIIQRGFLRHLPRELVTVICVGVLGLIFLVVIGKIGIITGFFGEVVNVLIKPTTSRLGVTVAENRQPYYGEWAGSFGPVFVTIPLFLMLFLTGSVYLVYNLFSHTPRKQRWVLTGAFAFMIIAIVFSRYDSTSLFNGENAISIIFYFLGLIAFACALLHFYITSRDDESLMKLGKEYIGILLVLTLFFFTLISVRGAVRLILILVPAASILGAYILTVVPARCIHIFRHNSSRKALAFIIAAVVIFVGIISAYQFYWVSIGTAQGYVPSIYTQQWQEAMAWVRENTAPNAVFGHWWDYGYWVQSIGERGTVLDGGNAIPYWNHLMGRYALTGTDSRAAAEFLYAHNTTHFLIDSSDIGKYTAFSSIGSDVNYDRDSWIQAFVRDDRQTQETRNTTLTVYTGGSPLDADIIYKENASAAPLFLAREKTGIGGVIIEKNSDGTITKPVLAVFISNGKQYSIPLRYLFSDSFHDFGTGLEAGVFLMPRVAFSGQTLQLAPDGALLYLSNRTVKSQLARLYLYDTHDPIFKLVHSEDDFLVKSIKTVNATFDDDIIYYDGVRGPIKIWELHYPADIVFKPEFINTTYPDTRLYQS